MGIKVGKKAPDFTLPSHLDRDISLKDLRGKTVVMAFFPMAWTPVCTNQIPSYEELLPNFEELNVQVLGISIDHVPCLKSWAESLGGISYPLLSDFWPHGKIAKDYGVLIKDEGKTERAVIIIDKEGVIRYIDVHDIDEQPSNEALFAEINKILPAEERRTNLEEKAKDEALPHGGVVMYCTKWCPDCKVARRWFKEHNIEFTEVNITGNAKASEQVREWTNGNLTTPTFDIDGTIIIDWQEDKLAEALL